jgi:hypothetical protein
MIDEVVETIALEHIGDALGEVNQRLTDLNARVDAFLGVEGIERAVGMGFGELIGVLRPLRNLAPAGGTAELDGPTHRALARMRQSLATADWTGVGSFPAPTTAIPFIGAVTGDEDDRSIYEPRTGALR